jgi:hypothetical protein
MEQNIKEIIRQIGDIGEKLSRLPAEAGLPSIELDIVLGDIRNLYQKVKDLQEGRIIREEKGIAGGGSATKMTVPVQDEIPVPDDIPVPGLSGDAGKIREGQPAGEGGKKTPPASGTGTTEPAGKPEKEEAPARSAERAILADKYKSNKRFINESLAAGREDVGSRIQSKPIRNISSALGINDRFKLIKELFNGDKESFQNTIGVLDGASNFNEAFNYINATFDWDMEEESVQLLLDLVRRKFIVTQNE